MKSATSNDATRDELARSGVLATVTLKASSDGEVVFAWRTASLNDFLSDNRATFLVTSSEGWSSHELQLPATDTIIHLRLHLAEGKTLVRDITAYAADELFRWLATLPSIPQL